MDRAPSPPHQESDGLDAVFAADSSRRYEELLTVYNFNIKHHDMWTLRPGVWLNDEVVNVWFQHLEKAHKDRAGEKIKK